MLVPVILPFQITAAIFVVVLVAILLFVRRIKPVTVVLLSLLLFIPSCMGIGFIVDAIRYGTFEYKTAAEIADPYVEIPKNATSITLHKFASGHEVRFTVGEEDLLNWMDAVVERRKRFADPTPFRREDKLRGDDLLWERNFARWGWSMPDDVVRYEGWRSARGSGFDVWYSPSTQTGYISAGYW